MRKRTWKRLAFNVHLLVSLAFGLFISIVAVTGAVIGFEPEIDRLLYSGMSYVKPGERFLTLARLQEAIATRYPDEPIVAVLPAVEADLAWQVVLPSGIAYVNPYTGEILGLRARGESFLGRVRAVHVGLTGGWVGGEFVKWSTVATVPLLLTGMLLWLPRHRLGLRWPAFQRSFWLDLHNTLGVGTCIFLLLLASTGTAMAFSDALRPHLYRIAGGSPKSSSRYVAKLGEPHRLTPDEALESAKAAAPGTIPYRVQLPAFGGTYVVDLVDQSDAVLGERHSVVLDPHSGVILLQRKPNDVHAVDRWMTAIAKLHVGALVGKWGKALFCFASFLTVAIFASGVAMLWLRTRIHPQHLFREDNHHVQSLPGGDGIHPCLCCWSAGVERYMEG